MEDEIQEEYISRIRNVLTFIEDHLDDELSLQSVAQVAHYSPFHFHRIFKAVTRETLYTYIKRKRIEKAAAILIRRKEVSISGLALKYGFNSNASFTRAFKKFYGLSPSRFRKLNPDTSSKICKVKRKNGQKSLVFESYICPSNHHKNQITMHAKVAIKEMPKLNVAFITHIGKKGIEHSFDQLIRWARPRDLLTHPNTKILTIYHDSFKITAPDKVRISAGITVDQPIIPNGIIGSMHIEKGRYIVGNFEIGLHEFEKSWNDLFIWMNENGYEKAEKNPFEIHHNNYNEHPEKKCIVDLCIPIVQKQLMQ